MKTGDLVRITKEYGRNWQLCNDGQFDCAGMSGIFIRLNQPKDYFKNRTATVRLLNGIICEIDAPHVWIEVISESR